MDPLPDVTALAELVLATTPQVGDAYRELLSAFDRAVVAAAAKRDHHNQVHMADRLGISRTTLRDKLKRAGLTLDGHRRRAEA